MQPPRLSLLLIAVLLFFLQDRLIYHPRRYEADFRSRLRKDLVELTFTTGQGHQSAFYLPAESGRGLVLGHSRASARVAGAGLSAQRDPLRLLIFLVPFLTTSG